MAKLPAQTVDLSALAHLFESDEFMGAARPLPHAQLLNHDINFGLFIKEDSMKRVGWTGPAADFKHRFRGGDIELGYHSTNPHIKVLRRSPLFVEDRKTKTLLADLSTPEGQRIRNERGTKGTTIRSLWLLYVCDENGVRYHTQPLVLSVHGTAGARLGAMYERWQQAIDDAYARATGASMIAARDQRVYSLFTFSPVLDMEMSGEGQEQSACCVVASYDEPTPEALAVMATQPGEMKALWQASAAYAGFDAKYLKSCEAALGFVVAPGVFADPNTGEIAGAYIESGTLQLPQAGSFGDRAL